MTRARARAQASKYTRARTHARNPPPTHTHTRLHRRMRVSLGSRSGTCDAALDREDASDSIASFLENISMLFAFHTPQHGAFLHYSNFMRPSMAIGRMPSFLALHFCGTFLHYSDLERPSTAPRPAWRPCEHFHSSTRRARFCGLLSTAVQIDSPEHGAAPGP